MTRRGPGHEAPRSGADLGAELLCVCAALLACAGLVYSAFAGFWTGWLACAVFLVAEGLYSRRRFGR